MAVRAQAGATRGEVSRGAPSFRLRLHFKGELRRVAPQLFLKVKTETVEIAKVEQEPRSEGRQIIMILAPKVKQ